ncbi:eukaryotic translation initiation factor 3 subunit J [Contarinia nasturtii]|uniref:eukaryotic translation initiation factor 3 subunit J n=1 Tax=Contarinia nasturtii TaxID=265458 RepID=UPI0012D49F7C|nr:eukaryotic translation initiation factor 3 subunit J [Contarinia nasturtii]
MEEDWEKLADEPVKKPAVIANINKWEGEDEDEVKDSWEDEDEEEQKEEEKKGEDGEAQVVKKTKPQKNLSKKIAERERLKQEEEERKAREREENMTPEEKLAEKLRLQKIQEEADLRAAMDTFGVTDKSGIDAIQPKNKTELSELADAISKKVSQYKHLVDFPGFLEELVRNVCVNLGSSDLQKIKKTVDNLYTEKQKLEKEKSKKGSKGKTKVNLRIETDNANMKEYGTYESYDYDDFM